MNRVTGRAMSAICAVPLYGPKPPKQAIKRGGAVKHRAMLGRNHSNGGGDETPERELLFLYL